MTVGELLALVDKFDWTAYHEDTDKALSKGFGEIVAIQGARGVKRAGGDEFDIDDPFVKKQLTGYVGDRIVSLDDTTRTEVSNLIRRVFDENGGVAPGELGDLIADSVRESFDGYADWRADRIARTETAIAYNFGNAFGYRQAGVDQVQVSDGDDDEDCRAVDGQIWTLDQALANPVAHPNCTRDFAPVIE